MRGRVFSARCRLPTGHFSFGARASRILLLQLSSFKCHAVRTSFFSKCCSHPFQRGDSKAVMHVLFALNHLVQSTCLNNIALVTILATIDASKMSLIGTVVEW
jgi:hypothetical protein